MFRDCMIMKLSSPDEYTFTTCKDSVGIMRNYSLPKTIEDVECSHNSQTRQDVKSINVCFH